MTATPKWTLKLWTHRAAAAASNILHYKLLVYGDAFHDAWEWVWDWFSSVTMYSYGATATCLDAWHLMLPLTLMLPLGVFIPLRAAGRALTSDGGGGGVTGSWYEIWNNFLVDLKCNGFPAEMQEGLFYEGIDLARLLTLVLFIFLFPNMIQNNNEHGEPEVFYVLYALTGHCHKCWHPHSFNLKYNPKIILRLRVIDFYQSNYHHLEKFTYRYYWCSVLL